MLQAASIPDPIKKAGGEDAHFILEKNNRYAVGVADGVGGWSEVGVDSGIYSRSLMNMVILVSHASLWIAMSLTSCDPLDQGQHIFRDKTQPTRRPY